jgi:hypothetical protein
MLCLLKFVDGAVSASGIQGHRVQRKGRPLVLTLQVRVDQFSNHEENHEE